MRVGEITFFVFTIFFFLFKKTLEICLIQRSFLISIVIVKKLRCVIYVIPWIKCFQIFYSDYRCILILYKLFLTKLKENYIFLFRRYGSNDYNMCAKINWVLVRLNLFILYIYIFFTAQNIAVMLQWNVYVYIYEIKKCIFSFFIFFS